MRFAHFADIHLGYQQYGLAQRASDIHAAWLAGIRSALAMQPDAVLLAGDVFHTAVIDPQVFAQVLQGLKLCEQAHVPVVVIEGNHDRTTYRHPSSWLRFLANQRRIKLLSHTPGSYDLAPWDDASRTGGWIDLPIGGHVLRCIGIPYIGAHLPNALSHLASHPPEGHADYTVLLLHGSLDGEMPHQADEVTSHHLDPLRPFVHYIAMGHIHKPYIRDAWIYNPGSLESISVEEAAWPNRGFYMVDVDMATGQHKAVLHTVPRREIVRVKIRVDEAAHMQHLLEMILDAIPRSTGTQSLFDISLRGLFSFPSAQFDAELVRKAVTHDYQPLHILLKLQLDDVAHSTTGNTTTQSHDEIEHTVLMDALQADPAFASQADAWRDMVLSVKQALLSGADAQEVADIIHVRAGTL